MWQRQLLLKTAKVRKLEEFFNCRPQLLSRGALEYFANFTESQSIRRKGDVCRRLVWNSLDNWSWIRWVIDDRSPDERIKFFEATKPPILTVWFVDLLKPLVIKKISEWKFVAQFKHQRPNCCMKLSVWGYDHESTKVIIRFGKLGVVWNVKMHQKLEIVWIRVDLPPTFPFKKHF